MKWIFPGLTALVSLASGSAAWAGGDCCAPNDDAGCADKVCTEVVCAIDPACCIIPWDAQCASIANENCVVCGATSNCCEIRPEPGCDVPSCEAQVCAEFPACCDVGWGIDIFSTSGICVDLAIQFCDGLCDGIADGCGHKGADTCCEADDIPWCDDEECCRDVCLGREDDPLFTPDSWCCLMEWDSLCAQKATNNPFCDCDGAPGDCCETNFDYAGCLEPACEECVCAKMPDCCQFSWTPFCVDVAKFDCPEVCGCDVFIPPCPEDTENNCCYPSFDEGGCADKDCCDAVCASNPGCCEGSWGFGCAEDAVEVCDACGSCTARLVGADPPDGIIDARQPFPPGGGPITGIGDLDHPIEIMVSEPMADNGCFTLCESATGGMEPNAVGWVQDYLNGKYELILLRAITPGAQTVIYYGDVPAAVFYWHPGNVNGDNITNPLDILALVDILNGIAEPEWGDHSTDIDRSGSLTPLDILALIDVLNGAGQLDAWNNTSLPAGCE